MVYLAIRFMANGSIIIDTKWIDEAIFEHRLEVRTELVADGFISIL